MMSDVPKFTLSGTRYDQSQFLGRFLGFLHMVDPRILLVTSSDVTAARSLLSRFEKEGTNDTDLTDEALWDAKKTIDGVIHPTFNEEIHPLFRMAGEYQRASGLRRVSWRRATGCQRKKGE